VVGGGRVDHISRYAGVRRLPGSRGRRWLGAAEYIVDLGSLRGLSVVEVVSTNRGLICKVNVCDPRELSKDPLERECEWKPLSELNGLEFGYLSAAERRFLEADWARIYLPMLGELREFFSALESTFGYVEAPELLKCQVASGASFPLSYLIPYSEGARRRSLEGLTKEIHQVWVASKILGALASEGRLISLTPTFKQSPVHATAVFPCRGPSGRCSLWYEFDANPHTMCGGMLWSAEKAPGWLEELMARARVALGGRLPGRLPLRPDLVVLEGAESCSDLEALGSLRVAAVIECKNQEYRFWAGDVDSQILPYLDLFKPREALLASLYPVPPGAKRRLQLRGVRVVDGVAPRGGGVGELVEAVLGL
jgi:hypothetical protein